MNPIRLAVIGIGNIGTLHLTNIEKLPSKLHLTAVCDIIPEKAQRAAEHYGCAAYTDAEILLKDGVADAVIIATPHYAHTTIGIAALDAGRHVLVEKPISVHKADAERLITAYERARARGETPTFAAMFNQRTDPRYRKVRQLVQQGELGALMRVNWIITNWFRTEAYYASSDWRATWAGEGGGVLLNQCVHNLDLFQWICGMPSKVWGFCGIGKHHEIEVEDEVTAYLEYPNGATGVFVTSTGEAPGTNRLELHGERGRVVLEDGLGPGRDLTFTRTEVSVPEFNRTSNSAYDQPPAWQVTFPISGSGGQHAEVLENFADAILSGVPLVAPAEEGLHSVELANAMLYSTLTGEPVTLPLDGVAFERELHKLIATSSYIKTTRDDIHVDIQASF
ncbi:MAG: Gfo/Idh/MocA family oxidoreductase [Anaerolineae bacterium]|jgi:predicted dehydrogenase|nr:Gfo/Idh/MocA family oxidoreductase [Anaerolineae bacterium]